jgi:flagellar biogenesis protein FliO
MLELFINEDFHLLMSLVTAQLASVALAILTVLAGIWTIRKMIRMVNHS